MASFVWQKPLKDNNADGTLCPLKIWFASQKSERTN